MTDTIVFTGTAPTNFGRYVGKAYNKLIDEDSFRIMLRAGIQFGAPNDNRNDGTKCLFAKRADKLIQNNKIEALSGDKCMICLDTWDADGGLALVLQKSHLAQDEILRPGDCPHCFHRGCFERWLHEGDKMRDRCPLCRSFLFKRHDKIVLVEEAEKDFASRNGLNPCLYDRLMEHTDYAFDDVVTKLHTNTEYNPYWAAVVLEVVVDFRRENNNTYISDAHADTHDYDSCMVADRIFKNLWEEGLLDTAAGKSLILEILTPASERGGMRVLPKPNYHSLVEQQKEYARIIAENQARRQADEEAKRRAEEEFERTG